MRTKYGTQELETKYKKIEGLIYHKAWRFHHSTGLPFDDFVGIGQEVFMRIIREQKHDVNKGAFTTLLYIDLNNAFIKYTTKEYRAKISETKQTKKGKFVHHILELLSWGYSEDPTKRMVYTEQFQDLTKEAKEVIGLVLSGPSEILGLDGTNNSGTIRTAILNYLRAEKGWSYPKVWRAFKEIKLFLYNL